MAGVGDGDRLGLPFGPLRVTLLLATSTETTSAVIRVRARLHPGSSRPSATRPTSRPCRAWPGRRQRDGERFAIVDVDAVADLQPRTPSGRPARSSCSARPRRSSASGTLAPIDPGHHQCFAGRPLRRGRRMSAPCPVGVGAASRRGRPQEPHRQSNHDPVPLLRSSFHTSGEKLTSAATAGCRAVAAVRLRFQPPPDSAGGFRR